MGQMTVTLTDGDGDGVRQLSMISADYMTSVGQRASPPTTGPLRKCHLQVSGCWPLELYTRTQDCQSRKVEFSVTLVLLLIMRYSCTQEDTEKRV